MIEFSTGEISSWLAGLLWPFFRIGGFFIAAPVIGTQLVPGRIRIILALLMTALIAPQLPVSSTIDPLSLSAFVITIEQLLIGIAMGFFLQILLQLFVLAGQMIAMQMGLGFASMVDPTNGVSVTVVSQFHLMLVTLLFLAMNGHLVMIDVLAQSFTALPVAGGFLSNNALWSLITAGGWMFASALLMALPAVTALLIINAALGVVTRAAPQLNIFAVGFPFMLLIGLCIIWVIVGGYLPQFEVFARYALEQMTLLTRQ